MSKAKEIELLISNVNLARKEVSDLANENEALRGEVEKLKKEVASERSLRDAYSKQRGEYADQIEQVNQFLDAVPDAVPRRASGENSWNTVDLTVMTRLAVWLGRAIHK